MKRVKTGKRILSIVLALMMLVSLIPITAMADTGSSEKTWADTAEGEILVKDTITKITNGVVEHEIISNTPAGNDQKIDYMCRANLSDTIKIVACYGENDASKWRMVSTTKQAAAYEKDHPGETVVAAINADFFNMATGEPLGALVMEGKQYHDAGGRWYFAILKDGTPVIRNNPDLSDCQTAVGGWMPLVKDGKACTENFEAGTNDYSRSTIGIMEDGSIVTSVTHGMLTPVSCGRTYKEIAEMYMAEGAKDVLVLDGGGSATYAARIEGSDKLEVRNSPSDGAEREVCSSLLIVSTAKSTGVFDHAALTPNNDLYTPGYEVQFSASGIDTAGFPMAVPADATWALADDSEDMGTIDAKTGLFKAGDKTGTVNVQMIQGDKVIGTTAVEIAVPDIIYFNAEEVSLGFEDESNLSLVVRNKDRDLNIKDGDIVWTMSTEGLGTFKGNTFVANSKDSLNGDVTATSKYDKEIHASIHVIVGMLPTLVWDFEDYVDPETGNVIAAQDYYCGENGILSTFNYGRGSKESIEIVSIDDDEPVRFGTHAMKLNFDFTDCGAVTEGACVGTSDEMHIPGAPTGLGVWVYAPEGVGVNYGSVKNENGELISGLWLRAYCADGQGKKCEVNFTLEPKDDKVQKGYNKDTGEWTVQPGIYWEGWHYLEADLTKWTGPFSFYPEMTFRLMFVDGTKMVGTQRTGELYFDNFQFVYGTNVDDVDAPVVDSVRVNDSDIKNGTVLTTDTLRVDAYMHDVQNKYTTGIDTDTIRMYVDGINVTGNDKYQFVAEPDGSIAHLYDLKLPDGDHTVAVSVRDKFGNETTEIRSFKVKTDNASTHSSVFVAAAESNAVIGKTVSLNVTATGTDIQKATALLTLGNSFKNYTVTFSDNYEGTYSYSKLTKILTVNAERKADAVAVDNNIIATVTVDIPSNLSANDKFNYTVKGGSYTTADGYYATYNAPEAALPITAAYNISAEVVLVGAPTTLTVTNDKNEPAANVDIYNAANNEKIGTTDEKGLLNTEYFSAASGNTTIYAKDAAGLLSFQLNVKSYDAAGEDSAMPYGLMFNALNDAAHGKSMTWMSNAIKAQDQYIRYRVSGTEDWTTVAANATLRTFTKGSNSAVNVNSITLSSLTPGTAYEYQIGGGDAWSEVATFKTVSSDKDKTRFFALGDIQDDDTTNIERVVSKLSETEFDFGIQTGDAVDDATAYSHWNGITNLFGVERFGSTDMIHVLGNHEYAGDANADAATNYFNLPTSAKPGSYYSLTYGDVYLAVVNYTGTAPQLKEAMDWLTKDAAQSNATWKVLLMHQPAYYTNSYGGNAEIYNTVPDVCEAAGIDVVFSGHDHSAARTNPLLNDEIDEENGVYYYICGSSGEKSYAITSQDKFDYSKIFKLVTDDFTATYLTVTADKDEMTIDYYDIDRGLLDTVTIESPCKRHGHTACYDPAEKTVSCSVCGIALEDYSGKAPDADGNEYYLLGGVVKTGWFLQGNDVFYANSNGVLQPIELDSQTKTNCTVRGKFIYSCKTVDDGDSTTYTVRDDMPPGHVYDNEDPKAPNRVCTVCGWHEVSLKDCKVELSYTNYTYTGKAMKPYVYVTAPDGTKLTDYYDYTVIYGENTEIGYGTVTVKPFNYYLVNLNQKRGSLCDDGTVLEYKITIHAPTVKDVKAKMAVDGIDLSWSPVAEADGYNIYSWISAKNEYKLIASVEGADTTAAKISDIKAGATYTIKVCAYNNIGEDQIVGYGETAKIIVPKEFVKTLQTPVVGTRNVADTGYIGLTWDAVPHADQYMIYRADTSNGEYKLMYTTTNLTYTNTTSKAGYTYYYKVVAVDSTGDYANSDYSKVVYRTCDLAQPIVKISVKAETGKPVISWNEVKGAARYELLRSTDGKNFSHYNYTINTTYTNPSTEPGTTYYYKVIALSDRSVYADSAPSVARYITCDCAKPAAKIAVEAASGKPVISWAAIDGAAKYEIYASADNKEFKLLGTTEALTYTDTSAKAGVTTYYKVKALCATSNYGDSALSNARYITCDCAAPVVAISINVSYNKPMISWAAVDGASKYAIYRSTDGKSFKYYDTTAKLSYTNISTTSGTTYYYQVKAVCATSSYGDSAFSNAASIKVP
ncbi:MAG: phosphodiester glycosidase family protein [Oscillospiraceae bacterium]